MKMLKNHAKIFCMCGNEVSTIPEAMLLRMSKTQEVFKHGKE